MYVNIERAQNPNIAKHSYDVDKETNQYIPDHLIAPMLVCM